jgi:hypothetical protein
MEYIRRSLRHVIRSGPDRYVGDGNFLQRLKEQRAMEEAQRLKDKERIERQREERAIANNEARRLQQEAIDAQAKRYAEIEAEKSRLRNEALDASEAPNLLGQLSQELGLPLIRESSHLYMLLSTGPFRKDVLSDDRKHYEDWYRAITVYGLEDGSVLIGSRILKPSDARNISRVDAAIEKNYRNPSMHVVRTPINTDEDPSRYESWNSGGW